MEALRKVSGAPVVAAVTFPQSAFRFTRGGPKYYKSSEFAERGFCEKCGSKRKTQSRMI